MNDKKTYNLENKIREISKGQVMSGVVKNIQPYGAFIQTDKGDYFI